MYVEHPAHPALDAHTVQGRSEHSAWSCPDRPPGGPQNSAFRAHSCRCFRECGDHIDGFHVVVTGGLCPLDSSCGLAEDPHVSLHWQRLASLWGSLFLNQVYTTGRTVWRKFLFLYRWLRLKQTGSGWLFWREEIPITLVCVWVDSFLCRTLRPLKPSPWAATAAFAVGRTFCACVVRCYSIQGWDTCVWQASKNKFQIQFT